MRFCTPHWHRLRDKIKELGLDKLGAQSGEEAAAEIVAQLEGMNDPKNYDPLMDCHNMIVSNAMKMGGIYLMMQPPEGDGYVDEKGARHYCPLCEAFKHRPADVSEEQFYHYWIEGPTGAALGHARQLGLVPNIQ